MTIVALIIALALLCHFKKRVRHYRRTYELDEGGNVRSPRARSWHEEWERQWAEKFRREAERRQRDWEQQARRYADRWERKARRRADRSRGRLGCWGERAHPWWIGGDDAIRSRAADGDRGEPGAGAGGSSSGAGGAAARKATDNGATATGATAAAAGESGAASGWAGARRWLRDATRGRSESPEQQILRRARRRAAAEVSFYGHLMSYLGVIAFLALVNLLTTRYPWFIWPALGWGIGLFAHWMAVFGSRILKQRYFDPAVEREVRRETIAVRTEKQAHIDELSATIAHEIRNPIAAAKSLVQQMGEDPRSVENVEYAQVALEELDRVERSISHLLRYAKEEDLQFAPVNLGSVLDSALTEMKAKLDAAKVAVARNYIGGPTLIADGEKLRQVFANVLDNAIDALEPVAEGRRIELFIDNGAPSRARVRVRDNGAGIPPEKIDRIFNPFFTTKDKGTGLGMAISKKIVEAHEGTIDVLSEPGRGAEFIITLPLPS